MTAAVAAVFDDQDGGSTSKGFVRQAPGSGIAGTLGSPQVRHRVRTGNFAKDFSFRHDQALPEGSRSQLIEVVEQALQLALWQRRIEQKAHLRPVFGTIHHSDAGSEYTSQRYTQTLADEGLIPSIGSIGDAFDNAAAETVMGVFKSEALARDSPFRTGALAAKADVDDLVVEWVHWYNNDRLHSTRGYRTPVEFEELYSDEITGTLPDVAASKLAALVGSPKSSPVTM